MTGNFILNCQIREMQRTCIFLLDAVHLYETLSSCLLLSVGARVAPAPCTRVSLPFRERPRASHNTRTLGRWSDGATAYRQVARGESPSRRPESRASSRPAARERARPPGSLFAAQRYIVLVVVPPPTSLHSGVVSSYAGKRVRARVRVCAYTREPRR